MTLYRTSDILAILKLILSNDQEFMNYSDINNQSESITQKEQKLVDLVQNYASKQNLNDIADEFITMYNIYVYFIVRTEGEFRIINGDLSLENIEQRGRAFVVVDGDHSVWSLLYAYNYLADKKQCVFTFDDLSMTIKVNDWIVQLNESGMLISSIYNLSFLIVSNFKRENWSHPVGMNSSNGKK